MQLSEFRGLGSSWPGLDSSLSSSRDASLEKASGFFAEWVTLDHDPRTNTDPGLISENSSLVSDPDEPLRAEEDPVVPQADAKKQPSSEAGFGDDDLHQIDGPALHDGMIDRVATSDAEPQDPTMPLTPLHILGAIPHSAEPAEWQLMFGNDPTKAPHLQNRVGPVSQGSELTGDAHQLPSGAFSERIAVLTTVPNDGGSVPESPNQREISEAGKLPIMQSNAGAEPRAVRSTQGLQNTDSQHDAGAALSLPNSDGRPQRLAVGAGGLSNGFRKKDQSLRTFFANQDGTKRAEQTPLHPSTHGAVSWGALSSPESRSSLTSIPGSGTKVALTSPLERHPSDSSILSVLMSQRTDEVIQDVPSNAPNGARLAGGFHQSENVILPQATLRDLAVQVRSHTQASGNSVIEIALRPEELGNVRILLSPTDTGLHVTISGERPETLELLRRNIEQLTQEFQVAGYQSVGVDIGDSDTLGHEDSDGEAATPEVERNEHGPEVHPNAGRKGAIVTSDGSLDIRI